ncbi:hypothetical protein GYH30_008502 [Glycine max]|nr:hypothetical protein GYH30_008502 [Glycine max]
MGTMQRALPLLIYLKLWESSHQSSNVPSVNLLLVHLGCHLEGWQF